ncbi:DUF4394 domain-containing protein [Acinetobacter guillouiae]|uniref:DUF4394 domain-containing protein n=1 Tax=Acinetobacter guillouiae TaxID=106649 RepID=UPI001CD588B9|nr:DUF4394 domain-containing protein [Acinetobacter guillouiae]
MKLKTLIFTLTTLGGIGLVGCNDSNSSEPPPLNTVTGDLLVLTSNGMISSINHKKSDTLVSNIKISGLVSGDQLIGMDHRPSNGKLYAVGVLGNIYILDPSSGVATLSINMKADPADTTDGNTPYSKITGNPDTISVNFNPAADRLRIIGQDGQNLRVNVDTGLTISDGQINRTGDPTPAISAAAYTNAFAETGSTKLYSIDSSTDRIYLQNANAGTLGASAPLGQDISSHGGFDIDPLNNIGFAALQVSGTYKLFQLNLAQVGTSNNVIFEMSDLPSEYRKTSIRGIALARADITKPKGIGLTNNNALILFEINRPNITTELKVTGGLVNEKFIGIDFRYRTTTARSNTLYGLTDRANLYTIDPNSGVATLVTALKAAPGSSFNTLEGMQFAVDFNPTADRLRVISNTGQNLRINVDTGETIQDSNINGIANASISAAAYTNSFPTPIAALGTELFDLDQANQLLTKQIPPNDGTLLKLGNLGVNLGLNDGFDIAGGDNGLALAAISNNGSASVLYRIDLNSDTTLTTPRARVAISANGSPDISSSRIGSSSTAALIDLAILFK